MIEFHEWLKTNFQKVKIHFILPYHFQVLMQNIDCRIDWDWKYDYNWLIESIIDKIEVQFPKQRFLNYVARKNKKIKTMKKRRKTSSYKIKLSFYSKFCELSILWDSFEFQVERKTIKYVYLFSEIQPFLNE